MATATQPQILEIPMRIYNAASGRTEELTLYFDSHKSDIGTWYEKMLGAQESGRRLPTSAEWFLGRGYLQQNNPQAERDFITWAGEWTGTVLDYERGVLLEGITVNPDRTIDAKIRLGKKEGFQLPQESRYVKDMSDRYMRTIAHLWGIEDPKRDLPDYVYL